MSALALVVSLALIVGVNYANDYSDGIRGTDDDRVGPQRLTGSGLAAPSAVKRAAIAAFTVAGLAGLVLSALSQPWLIAVGGLCIAAAWFYTGGNNPYGYRGFGEIAVFVFFGLVAVLGTQFVQLGTITSAGIVAAIAVGSYSSSVNLTNNLRDIFPDADSGKITLAVRLGEARTRGLHAALIIAVPLLATCVLAFYTPLALIALPAIAASWWANKPVRTRLRGQDLIPALTRSSLSMLAWSLLTAAGFAITAAG